MVDVEQMLADSARPKAPAGTETAEPQEMFAGMVAELMENVPELHTFFFKTNDAGSGICWSDWQYTGPNGPTHCKNHSMGEGKRHRFHI